MYIESGCDTLKPMIYKRQLKFFRKLKADCANNPNSSISTLLDDALQSKTTFLSHYKKLDRTFATPEKCFEHYRNIQTTDAEQKIQRKLATDPDSILGTYMLASIRHSDRRRCTKLSPVMRSTGPFLHDTESVVTN